jgi:hypothetical protein
MMEVALSICLGELAMNEVMDTKGGMVVVVAAVIRLCD